MFFPKDFPDTLRSNILTSEVVGKKVKLKQRGNEFQGLCPFHNEKSPSFSVNDQKGFYHCFGCQAHGDIISFVINNEGLEFKEAVIGLAEDFGIPIPQVEVMDKGHYNKLERDYLILEKACQFFEKNLYDSEGLKAREYLKSRSLTSTISRKFRLGFALNSYESLSNFLRAEGFNESELLRTGIIAQSDRKKIYDKLRNRIVFPILDKKNRVIAFGGRTISDDIPKYLNSAETNVFKKKQTLYNISLARKEIFTKSHAIVVEGYMDAIVLSANGIENVVAGLGTALSEDHLKELFHITDKIIICLDGDSAGIRAAKRVSEIALPLINSQKNLAFSILPNEMDPDDYIKKFGVINTEKTFKNAIPLSESLFDFTLMDLGIEKGDKISAENKAKIEDLLNIKVETIRDHSTKKYFSIFFKDLIYKLGREIKNKSSHYTSSHHYSNNSNHVSGLTNKLHAKPMENQSDILAKNIIAFIIKHPDLSGFQDDDFNIAELYFDNDKLSHIKDHIIDAIENNAENPLSTLEKSDCSNDIADIKNIVARIGISDANLIVIRFRILLFKDLLLRVDQQYRESLGKIDEIETHQSAITDQKIKEIFDYKNSLEQQILSLEKEII